MSCPKYCSIDSAERVVIEGHGERHGCSAAVARDSYPWVRVTASFSHKTQGQHSSTATPERCSARSA